MIGVLIVGIIAGAIAAIVIAPRYFRSLERQKMAEVLRASIERGQPLPQEMIDAMSNNVRGPPGEMPPMLPMLPMMMPMMMMMMPDMPQDCNNSGQNSGTVPPVPMVTIKAPNQSSNPADPVQYITVPATNTPPVKCPPNYNSGSTDAYGNTGAGAGVTPASGGAVSDLISSLLGGNDGSSNGGSGTGSSGSGEGSATSSGNKTPRGVFGDILFATGMATVLEINQDQSHNAASAGFYGLNSPGATGKQLVSALCRTRPWSNSYLSFIVPPTFFDNLCTLRGFGAGAKSSANGNGKTGGTVTSSGLYIPTPMAVIPGGLTDLPVTKSDAPTKKPVSPKTPLATDIWATPASVASGAKTTIFWNTSGVTDCTVASTDVTFSYTSLTGHAATPSITKPTSFTLTCTTDGGAKVTSHVTVGITQ